MKNALILLLVLSPSAYAGKVKYNYEVKNSVASNINSFVIDDETGRDIEELDITAGLKKGIKLSKKLRLNLKTDINLKLHNLGDAFDDVELENDDDVNTTLKKASISQKVSLATKLSKRIILSLGGDIEVGRGYTVAQDFINTPGSIGYVVIDDPYFKYSFNVSGSLKLNKKIKLRSIYQFTEYNHEKDYTFLPEQGSNDRRINTLGLLGSFRASKNFDAALSTQIDQITYRDRLALDNNGLFRQTGEVEASDIRDIKAALQLNFIKKILSLKLERTDRDDQVNNGDGRVTDKIELAFKYSVKKLLDLELSYEQVNTDYKSQIAFTSFTGPVDPNADNRKDKQVTVKGSVAGKLAFLGKKAPKLKLFADHTEIDSNNVFGEYDNTTIGLAISGKF